MNKIGEYRKAVVAFLGTLGSSLLLVMDPESTFADITQYQWVVIAVSVVSVPAIVSAVPNDTYTALLRKIRKHTPDQEN